MGHMGDSRSTSSVDARHGLGSDRNRHLPAISGSLQVPCLYLTLVSIWTKTLISIFLLTNYTF
jgi:hypothetical protein